jgi:acyl-coenzyme A thioesterase PaaI-like protein
VTSLQEQYTPGGKCFGCGPANAHGLGLRSYPAEDSHRAVATWHAEPHHVAVPGVVNGGVIATLLDCHTGAALALAVRRRDGLWPWAEGAPWATAEFTVTLLRPTPVGEDLHLEAAVAELTADTAVVQARMEAAGKVRATCRAVWKRLQPR